MVRECDWVRFRTVAKTGAEPWLKLWPEFERQAGGPVEGTRRLALLARTEPMAR